MDFARKQLEKYGWNEGKGLGKDENGIKSAIKAKPKHSLSGLGHNIADEFTDHWWQRVYNEAISNVEIVTDDVEANEKRKKDKKHRKSKNKITKERHRGYMSNFVKTSTLRNGIVEELSCDVLDDEKDCIGTAETELCHKIVQITDDELFEACGKRTAHKGARHGLISNGKLARIEMQEKLSMKRHKK